MDGRVLKEILRDGPDPNSIKVEKKTYTATSQDGTYTLTAATSTVNGHRYLDYTKAERKANP